MQALTMDDLLVRVQGNGVDFRTKDVGELTMGWVKLQKGVDLSGATVGLPDDLCPCPHWGYVIRGRLRMKTKDGSREFTAGEAFYWGPGHAPEALEDSEYVDFSPTEDLEKVIAHLTGAG
ncbi:MAG: hypothetical protein ACRD2A_02515 [Vicinamibacterales bacterium]